MAKDKGRPAQKAKDKQVKKKAAKQNAEVGSGPKVTNKSQIVRPAKKRRKAGNPK